MFELLGRRGQFQMSLIWQPFHRGIALAVDELFIIDGLKSKGEQRGGIPGTNREFSFNRFLGNDGADLQRIGTDDGEIPAIEQRRFDLIGRTASPVADKELDRHRLFAPGTGCFQRCMQIGAAT